MGLVRYHVFFVIRLATREVQIAGIIPEPHGERMKQVARNLTDGLDGFLAGCRHLIHDRSSLFTPEFGMILESVGIEAVRLPHEKNHQGLRNKIIRPDFAEFPRAGEVLCRERLGGMLRYYYRQAA